MSTTLFARLSINKVLFNKVLFNKVLCIVLLTLGLSACINTQAPPDTFYYVLEANPRPQQNNTATKRFKVLPVLLPNYMNQANLVLKLSDHQIKVSNYHYWADDLRTSIQRVLINELNSISNVGSFASTCGKCDTIEVAVDHFYPTQSGEVFLAGSYNIELNSDRPNTDSSQLQFRFNFQSQISEGGFEDAVKTMRQQLSQLAEQINHSVD